MKTRFHEWLGRSALSSGLPVLAATLLLAALPSHADTSFTTTNWVADVPVPGILCTNSSGQVSLKGNVHVHRVLSADARIAGRLTAWMDMAYQADGTALLVGSAYVEPGTWDASGAIFTPVGGVWDVSYNGTVQADGSDQIHLVGYGIGGTIEGLRLECTATKGPGAPFDPAIPYLASGIIESAPVDTQSVLDDFDDNSFDSIKWWSIGGGSGTLTVTETNQQLAIGGTWTTPTYNAIDHNAWVAGGPSWQAVDGQTIEVRADLVSLNQSAAGAVLALYHANGQGYGLAKAGDWIFLWKLTHPNLVCYRVDRVSTSNTNVVLAFALTPVGQNVVLTGKVLDKSGTILHQLSTEDTPASDPALSPAEVAQLTGWRVMHDVGPELIAAPWRDGNSVCLQVTQDTDGTLPTAEVTFDNIELFSYEIPRVGIQPAVQLTWPSTGMNFGVEAAPTVDGPWLPVANDPLPGWQQMTLPQAGPMQFFRAVPAP